MSSSESDDYESADELPREAKDKKCDSSKHLAESSKDGSTCDTKEKEKQETLDPGTLKYSKEPATNAKALTEGETIVEKPREKTEVIPKENIKENPKENIKENPKENIKENPKENIEGNLIKKIEESDADLNPHAEKETKPDSDLKNIWSWCDVNSFLSTATRSVSTLTTQVSSGISSVIETNLSNTETENAGQTSSDVEVQNPDVKPEEPASVLQDTCSAPRFDIACFLDSVGHVGNMVISEGLNTLETLGQITMDVLQDNDPGFKMRRAILFRNDKTNLSDVIREAKKAAEEKEGSKQEQGANLLHYNFEEQFKFYDGPLHYAELEATSRKCSVEIQEMLCYFDREMLNSIHNRIRNISELFSGYNFEDEWEGIDGETLSEVIDYTALQLHVPMHGVSFADTEHALDMHIIKDRTRYMEIEPRYAGDEAVRIMAKFTACALKLIGSIAQQLMDKNQDDVNEECQDLAGIIRMCINRIIGLAKAYNKIITNCQDENTNKTMELIFIEAANGTSYMLNTFKLFVPILQLRFIKEIIETDSDNFIKQ